MVQVCTNTAAPSSDELAGRRVTDAIGGAGGENCLRRRDGKGCNAFRGNGAMIAGIGQCDQTAGGNQQERFAT